MIGSKFLVSKKKPILAASGVTKQAEDEDHTLRNVGMGAAFSYPLGVGLINSRRAPATPKGGLTRDFKHFLTQIQPGDVIAAGRPDYYKAKNMIALVSGQPDYYHIMTAMDNVPVGEHSFLPRSKSFLADELMTNNPAGEALGRKVILNEFAGSGQSNTLKHLTDAGENYRILRPVNPAHARRIVDHAMSVYNDVRPNMYSWTLGVNTGKDNIFKPNIRSLSNPDFSRMTEEELSAYGRKQLKCYGGMCSNLPATALPEIWDKPSGKVLPTDIINSPHFETVLDYNPEASLAKSNYIAKLTRENPSLSQEAIEAAANRRFKRWDLYNDLLRGGKAHWYTRLGVGLGGAGAVAAASRIPDSDLSLGEGLAAAGLLSAPIASSRLANAVMYANGYAGTTAMLKRREALEKEMLENVKAYSGARDIYSDDVIKSLDARRKDAISRNPVMERVYKKINREQTKDIKAFLDRYGLKTKQLNIAPSAVTLGTGGVVNLQDMIDRSSSAFDAKNNIYLDVLPDRPSYLTELGKVKYYMDRAPLLQRVKQQSPLSTIEYIMAELGARKNAAKYLREKEGLRSALKYLKESLPELTVFAGNTVLPKLSKIAPVMGLAGAGLLGTQLYKDKEKSSLDTLREALGLGG